jgi:hypothetical protein
MCGESMFKVTGNTVGIQGISTMNQGDAIRKCRSDDHTLMNSFFLENCE